LCQHTAMFRFESPSDFPRQVSFSDLTGIIQRITAPSFYQNTVSTVISPQPFYDIVRSRSSRFSPCAILVTVLRLFLPRTAVRQETCDTSARRNCQVHAGDEEGIGIEKNRGIETSFIRSSIRVFTKNEKVSIYFITYLLTHIIYVEITYIIKY